MLIEVKAKVARKIDNKVRKRMETYLVEREFFSEAEYTVTDWLTREKEYGEVNSFEIQSLRMSPIKEIADQYSGEYPYIATLIDIFTDDDNNEKKLKYKVLLWADSLTQANQRAQALSKEGYDMLIEGIKQVDYEYLVDPV